MWNTEIFFARKMKFLFVRSIRNYSRGSINLRIVALIITEGFTTSSSTLLYFAVYQTRRSKRWKAGTSSSSPFLVKNVTFLFDKKYLHDSVQRFESLLVIMHSPCKTPRIRFSGCFQFSRLVRLSIPETASHEFQRRGEPSVLFRGRSPSEIQREYFTAVKSNSCSREQRTKSRRNGWPARMKSPI